MAGFRTISADFETEVEHEALEFSTLALNVDSIDEIREFTARWVEGSTAHAQHRVAVWMHHAVQSKGLNHAYVIVAGPVVSVSARGHTGPDPYTVAAKKSAFEKKTLTAAKLIEQIAALSAGKAQTIKCECVSGDDDAGPQLRDRGTWTADESYAVLDRVSHPSDETKYYVAVQAGKSDSVAVLDKPAFWLAISA